MKADLIPKLLTTAVISGKWSALPWSELASTHFLAENKIKSWKYFCEWARKYNIGWRLEKRGKMNEEIWIIFTPPTPTRKADAMSSDNLRIIALFRPQ